LLETRFRDNRARQFEGFAALLQAIPNAGDKNAHQFLTERMTAGQQYPARARLDDICSCLDVQAVGQGLAGVVRKIVRIVDFVNLATHTLDCSSSYAFQSQTHEASGEGRPACFVERRRIRTFLTWIGRLGGWHFSFLRRRLMKKTMSCFALAIVAGVLSLVAAGPAQAAYTYYDVTPLATGNTVDSTTGTYNNWDLGVDGASPLGWRTRNNSGPGIPAAPAGNGTAYTGFQSAAQPDPPLTTTITGLTPGAIYEVRIYGVYPGAAPVAPALFGVSTSRHFAEVSANGSTWEWADNRDAVWATSPAILQPTFVDASNGGVGAPLGGRGTADTRYYSTLATAAVADGTGAVKLYVRLPLNDDLRPGQLPVGTPGRIAGTMDRWNLDGWALQQVPEPASIGMLGFAGVMGLMARRRK
jgi:hypothetical protein